MQKRQIMKCPSPVLFRVVTGSRLYGIALEDSDTDTAEIQMPDYEELTTGNIRVSKVDSAGVYSLLRFLDILANGSSCQYAYLFADPIYVNQEYLSLYTDLVSLGRNGRLTVHNTARSYIKQSFEEWDEYLRTGNTKMAAQAFRLHFELHAVAKNGYPTYPLPEHQRSWLLAMRQGMVKHETIHEGWNTLLQQNWNLSKFVPSNHARATIDRFMKKWYTFIMDRTEKEIQNDFAG